MNEFLINNWFSIVTLVMIGASAAVHYGISKQRQAQTTEGVQELKALVKEEVSKLDEGRKHNQAMIQAQSVALQAHLNNGDIHVSNVLLELLKTRHDFIIQQLTETRLDIGRIREG